jgi:predicted transcriptional regulator
MGEHIETIPSLATISEAVRRMHVKDADTLVVIDGDGRIAGVITERDIVRLFRNISSRLSCMSEIYELVSLVGYSPVPVDTLVRVIDLVNCYTVESMMERDYRSVFADEAVIVADRLMTADGVERLLVVDRDRKFKGAISRKDIVNSCIRELYLCAQRPGDHSRSRYKELNLMLGA